MLTRTVDRIDSNGVNVELHQLQDFLHRGRHETDFVPVVGNAENTSAEFHVTDSKKGNIYVTT